MSVPPLRPSSTPPSKGSPNDDQDSQKTFQLPGRKEAPQGQQDQQQQKKKGVFDLTGEDIAMQSKQQGLQQSIEAAEVSVGQTAGIEAAAQVSQVSQLIQKMVASMRIGQLDGQEFASLDLKASTDVPTAFAGSTLTLSYQANGLAIHFDNFMTPQQQNNAITLVEQNKEQLQQMVEALNAKNIQVTQLTLGTHSVALPRVEGLPPPFQPITTAQTEPGRQQQDQGEGREKDQDQEPQ